MSMPASEFVEWQAYFEIFPFNEDRADRRAAMLASVLSYSSGRVLKQPVPESVFILDYLGDITKSAEPSLEQQTAEFKAFADKLRAAKGNK